ncbi:MAG: EF-hand domain-containing protein [Gammaproteobacteria bacterium]|nr:EF-hand domain-containing protein [Gammaproteobacteria bacterium]
MAERDPAVAGYVDPGGEERARLREDFDFNDANGDGRITFGEFTRFMAALDSDITAEECRIGFEAIDSDGNGVISFEEFVAWWAER